MNYRTARYLVEELLESPLNTTAGIYYVVRYPKGWKFVPNKDSEDTIIDHAGLWETLAFELATQWSSSLATGISRDRIYRKLLSCHRGFPRGRITVQGLRQYVRFGDDFQPFMGITKTKIESAFGLNAVKWHFDPHETCKCSEKETIRELFRLAEDWKCSEL